MKLWFYSRFENPLKVLSIPLSVKARTVLRRVGEQSRAGSSTSALLHQAVVRLYRLYKTTSAVSKCLVSGENAGFPAVHLRPILLHFLGPCSVVVDEI